MIAAVSSDLQYRAARVRVRYRRVDGELVDTTLDRVAVDDVVGGLPVREFRSYRGRRHYSGWYWSSTVERLVAYESRLELARIMLADFDPTVVAIAAQPFQLVGSDGPRIRRHVPDVLLMGADGEVTVVDVKAPSKLTDSSVQAVFSWTRRVAAWRGWGFEVWSGADQRVLDNVRFLAGYRRPVVVAGELIPAVLEAAREQLSIGSIERALADRHPPVVVRPVVLHLLWAGRLRAEADQPLGLDTPVRLAREGSV
jgi:hypothetical protein